MGLRVADQWDFTTSQVDSAREGVVLLNSSGRRPQTGSSLCIGMVVSCPRCPRLNNFAKVPKYALKFSLIQSLAKGTYLKSRAWGTADGQNH
eukprot:5018263-Amphidinium_carterae.1